MGKLLVSRVFIPIVAVLCGIFFYLRPGGIEGPKPEAVPQVGKGFSHDLWTDFLTKVRREDGTVDFAAVHLHQELLDRYIGSLRAACPRSTPHRFRDHQSRLAYYLNAYNAILLNLLVRHCPMQSPSELYWANGLFWRVSILVGESPMTLTDLETQRLEPLVLRDPRVRLALFRGTTSAPLLQKTAFLGETIDAQLNEIASGIVDDPRFVSKDGNQVRLNPVFYWNQIEFGDFRTWFKSHDVIFSAETKFVRAEYDDEIAQWNGSCGGLKAVSAH